MNRFCQLTLLIMCWCLVGICAMAQQQTSASLLSPTYLNQRQFFLPYKVEQSGRLIDRIAKVQLLLSRTGANDWATLEEAEPHVQGFTYYAPEDGEYWFAVRHLDRRGRPWPTAEVQPQRRIVIDTQRPELTVEASEDTNGEIVIRYEARDANLQAETLDLEVRTNTDDWRPLRREEPDLAQENRLVGRVRWRPPAGTEHVEIRASVADRAALRAQATKQLAVRSHVGPTSGPALGSPSTASVGKPKLVGTRSVGSPREITDPFTAREVTNPFVTSQSSKAAKLPSQDWPLTNRLQTPPQPETARQTPPQFNPYTMPKTDSAPTARLSPRNPISSSDDTNPQQLQITPLSPGDLAAGPSSTPWPTREDSSNQSQDLWSSSESGGQHPARIVNSRTFDIEYDLESIGPWGVSKVELWGTTDNGQTWRSFAIDPDNRSPVRVTVPGAGTFGFRILVDGANSAGAAPPQAGDEPELVVAVDLQPPTAKLLGNRLGTGNLSDHLVVSWTASDSNLEPRPIALFYSSFPNGPWSTIASGLENTGNYTWRIERHVPGRFYLRLEARDTAGNVATYQASAPVELARPQPTGRLRNVRPITDD